LKNNTIIIFALTRACLFGTPTPVFRQQPSLLQQHDSTKSNDYSLMKMDFLLYLNAHYFLHGHLTPLNNYLNYPNFNRQSQTMPRNFHNLAINGIRTAVQFAVILFHAPMRSEVSLTGVRVSHSK
jgi:hypothetical protein